MATVFLAPTFGAGYQSFLPNGLPNSGGFLNTYLAGTTTPSATWTTSSGTINNAISIPLDASGKPPNEIWFTGGTAYKIVVADSGNNPIGGQTYDNLSGINDTIGSSGTGGLEWTATNLTPTYISSTSFSVPGNATTTFQIGRRTKTTNTGGTIYSSITNSVFGGGITTVTVVNDTGNLDSGLSAVFIALLGALDPSVPAILPYSLAITGITGAAITTSSFSGSTVTTTGAISGGTTVGAGTSISAGTSITAGTTITATGGGISAGGAFTRTDANAVNQAATGHVKLNNGIILNWGINSGVSVPGTFGNSGAGPSPSFDLAFPTACTAVTVQVSGSGLAAVVVSSGPSTSGFGTTIVSLVNSSPNVNLLWIAVGY